jgi:hypothetical protein
MERRRFNQVDPLDENLSEQAERLRKEARGTPPGIERDKLLRRARQIETACVPGSSVTRLSKRMTRDPRMRRTAVISPGQISLVLEDEEEAMRIAQAIADITGKRITLMDANGLELGTVKGRGKLSRH